MLPIAPLDPYPVEGIIRAGGGGVTSDRLPRKLIAIVYADVAGYSRLTGKKTAPTSNAI